MSRLKLYWPDEQAERGLTPPAEPRIADEDAAILPFRSRRAVEIASGPMLEVLVRAQLIRENRCCPHCEHPVVEPIELQDALVNRSGLPIPGTATLVGFRCESCLNEWPV